MILFHCGPIAQSLMEKKGIVTDHKMFAKANPGCGWGSNEGRIAAFPMTFSNCKTENGRLTFYIGEGRFTGEPIDALSQSSSAAAASLTSTTSSTSS